MKDEKNFMHSPPRVCANHLQRGRELAARRPHREYLPTERNSGGLENLDQ
jgi:hypothetical protein